MRWWVCGALAIVAIRHVQVHLFRGVGCRCQLCLVLGSRVPVCFPGLLVDRCCVPLLVCLSCPAASVEGQVSFVVAVWHMAMVVWPCISPGWVLPEPGLLAWLAFRVDCLSSLVCRGFPEMLLLRSASLRSVG